MPAVCIEEEIILFLLFFIIIIVIYMEISNSININDKPIKIIFL